MALTLEGQPWYVGLVLGLVLGGLSIFAVKYFLINDIDSEISSSEGQIADLDKKIEQGRAAERKLPQFREEVHRLEIELDKLRRILPSTRNTEEIIKKVKSVVDQGDFVLHRMTLPQLAPAQGSDPYSEWPISISLDGRYHNLAMLFNRLSNFSRIMNIEQITITALPTQLDRTISADFVAKTFVYVEPKEEAEKPAKAGSKPAGAGE